MFVYLNINYKKKTAKMSLLDTLQTVKFHVSSVESSLTELENGRKAAAPRARKSIQSSRRLLSELRKLIMLSVKALPVNKRVNPLDISPTDISPPPDISPTDISLTPPPPPAVEDMKPKRKYVKRSLKKEDVV
jgi:hypothetical protein